MLFCNAEPDAEEHLKKRSKFEELTVINSIDEVEAADGRGYYCRKQNEDGVESTISIGTNELESFLDRYKFIVFFHPFSNIREIHNLGRVLSERVIGVNEYGMDMNRNGSRIFFKDYKTIYKGMIDEEKGYMKLKVGAKEFRESLSEKKQMNFRLDYIEELEKKINGQPYFFAYYDVANDAPPFDIIARSLETTRFCMEAYALKEEAASVKPVLLSNIDLRKAAESHIYYMKYSRWLDDVIPKGFAYSNDDEVEISDLLEQWKCTIDNDSKTAGIKFDGDKEMKMVYYDSLSPEEFEYLFLKSEYVMGCTGDMSVTQALSPNRMIVYETLPHKEPFYDSLNRKFKKAGSRSDADLGIPFIKNDYIHRKLPTPPPNIQEIYKVFLEKLREDSFQKWFEVNLQQMLSD